MTAILSLLLLLAGAAACVFGALYFRTKLQVERYRHIKDAEAYQASCQSNAQTALTQFQNLNTQSTALNQQIAAQKNRIAQYQQLLGTFQTAAELHQRIQNDTARAREISLRLGNLDRAEQLQAFIRNQEAEIAQKRAEIDSYTQVIGAARTISEVTAQVTYYQNLLAQLKADVEAVEEAKALQEFGFYRPRYDFDSVEAYQDRLDVIRSRQKTMLSAKSACTCNTEWTVDGSASEGKKMVNQQIKLMLRAFNGECDAAVSKASYNNVVSLENRIQRSFEQINKLGEAKRIHLSPEFYNLKLDELHLAYEFQQKKQEEREVQRQIREQMREEQKVAKEIEKACEAAERDEDLKRQALERARTELMLKTGQQTAKLESLVIRLENELKEALDRKARAIARAQLTKSGHVYILSNIGSFGDGVYKIGMSRRLEPLERVDELGGASVPFPFDVHAMIYSENAPELENALHRHFDSRRVNMVNLRREFFRVSLDEIRGAVAQLFGQVTFVTVPEAPQYRQTIAMIKDCGQLEPRLQIA